MCKGSRDCPNMFAKVWVKMEDVGSVSSESDGHDGKGCFRWRNTRVADA